MKNVAPTQNVLILDMYTGKYHSKLVLILSVTQPENYY